MKPISILISLCLLAGALLPGSRLPAQAASVSSLQSQYDKLESQLNSLQKELKNTQNKKDQQVAYKKALDGQINTTMAQLDILEQTLNTLSQQISDLEDQINHKTADIDQYYAQYKDRIRAGYLNSNLSTLQAILDSSSFSEFLLSVEIAKRIAEYDQQVMDNLADQKKQLQDGKAQLQTAMNQQAAAKSNMEKKKQDLDAAYSASNSYIQKLTTDEASNKEYQANLKEEMDELQKQIEAIYAANVSNAQYVGGTYAWPVPGFYRISSPYGQRTNDFHTGMDIVGAYSGQVYGANVIAANTGKVIAVRDLGNRSYGKYLIIDHGGGRSTLYAHLSAILVSEGQTVMKGQVIARVGSTGNSTGPHLHFETRKNNGQHYDPMTEFQSVG